MAFGYGRWRTQVHIARSATGQGVPETISARFMGMLAAMETAFTIQMEKKDTGIMELTSEAVDMFARLPQVWSILIIL